MASGASAFAIIAVLAIMVLSSQGQQETGPLCSDYCESLCTKNCVDRIFNTCKRYCENPMAARQDCEKRVFQACTVSSCCNNNCSRDCILEAENSCQFVHDTTFECQSCTRSILEYCPPACYSDCNRTCEKK